MDKLVSIIVPMYNAELTIKKCISSLIYQTYKNIEIIVVDDGSIDSSKQMIKEFDNRIEYVYQSNKGVSAARNTGIKRAEGEYILFVDSDDCIEVDFVSKTVIFAEKNKLDIVVAKHMEQNSTIFGGNENKEKSFIAKENFDIVEHFKGIHIGQAVGKLFRTCIVKTNNITFPEQMFLAEDFYFVGEILLNTNKVGLVDNTHYCIFNVNINSLSKRYIDNILLGIEMQIDLWNKLTKRYDGLDLAYAKDDMDYRLHKAKMYYNNFFKKGSKYSFMSAMLEISEFIDEHPELFTNNIPVKYYPNVMRKIEGIIIKSKLSFVITSFYYIKERIKKLKLSKSGKLINKKGIAK